MVYLGSGRGGSYSRPQGKGRTPTPSAFTATFQAAYLTLVVLPVGGGLPPGRVTLLLAGYSMGSSGTMLSLAPHQWPICLGRPCQEQKAPDNAASRFTGARKPHHHDKVIVPKRDKTLKQIKIAYLTHYYINIYT